MCYELVQGPKSFSNRKIEVQSAAHFSFNEPPNEIDLLPNFNEFKTEVFSSNLLHTG